MLPKKLDAYDINLVSRCYRLSRCYRRRSSCSISVRSCCVINSRCRWCSYKSSSRCFAARSRSSTAIRAASTSRTRVATFYFASCTARSLLSRLRAASSASRPNSFPMLSSSFNVCSIVEVARSTTRTASSALGIYRTTLSTLVPHLFLVPWPFRHRLVRLLPVVRLVQQFDGPTQVHVVADEPYLTPMQRHSPGSKHVATTYPTP